MRGWGGCLGTNPFRGAARCGTSEAIPHKDATTTRNSLTRLSPRSRRELRRGADLGTRTPAVDPTCRSANPVFRLHPRCATRLQRLSDFPRFTRASSALHSRFSRVSMAPHSEGSKNSYMDQCTFGAVRPPRGLGASRRQRSQNPGEPGGGDQASVDQMRLKRGFRGAQTGFPAIAATPSSQTEEAAVGDLCALFPLRPLAPVCGSTPPSIFLKAFPSFPFLLARLSPTLGSRPKQSRLGQSDG